ncbi:hypothetical protein CUMW_225330 [Citrus unshiu]|uniref:Uncharacterized protein n=2 Tax=Citrus TaxID=2706 RepID=A0A067E931_CITSI|nr:hypothetical protein CISIN_1g045664mg [Citrus sinensis]GAY63409.1 hypothetical protein CUMW_225330 [Citrus unshiu]
MGSKIILLLGLAMALVLLTSSEVAARNLAETSTNMRKAEAATKNTFVKFIPSLYSPVGCPSFSAAKKC